MAELFTQHPWLWPLAWQSTASLAAGLGASFFLRRRPARAHQLLLLSLVAAMFVPVMSGVVRQNQWGLFVAEPTVPAHQTQPFVVQANPAGVAAMPTSDTPVEPSGGATLPMSPAHAPAAIRWETALALLWLAASTVLLLRLAIRLVLGLCLVRRSEPLESPQIAEALDAAKPKPGIEHDVLIRAATHAQSPVIWCWGRKPILLIPGDSANDTQLDWPSVICHELAHWKRRDHISALFAELTICLLPWQALAWLARRRLVDLSEEACDDWVIASGQAGTRYARTLLGLAPLGRAALVPAVVTTRKGLAGRIRRIVENQCSNPRSGRRWALAVVVVTVGLGVAVALAQTRPAQSTDTSRNILAHGAVIEQAAPAMMITGRVLNPNGEPAIGARVIVLPMTMYSVETPLGNNGDGHFEIPWSPAWLEPGENPCLMAVADVGAAFAETTDPTSPVTIQLQPAATLTGQVVDPNGRPIVCNIDVSLARAFRSAAPLFNVTWRRDDPGKFSQSKLPYGQKYKLFIRAEGYQPLEIIADTTNTSRNVVDLGRIILQPTGAAHSAAAEREPDPDLLEMFQRVYRLDEGETVKFIKAPFVLGRHEKFLDAWSENFPGLERGSYFQIYFPFPWSDESGRNYATAGSPPRLDVDFCARLQVPPRDVNIPGDLKVRLPPGDWVVRAEATVEERLRALEEIIYAETHRTIRFERHAVKRDTIVVTGRYRFTPLSDKDPNRLYLIGYRTPSLHKGELGTLPRLLRRLADGLNIDFEDRTERVQIERIPYMFDSGLIHPGPRTTPIEDKEKELPALLDNLARQTGLQFKVEKQPAEVWIVTEKAPSNP